MNNDGNIDENLWDQVTILRKKNTSKNNTLKKNALDKFNNITFNVAVGKKKSSKKKNQ